nr:hypothetical protein [Salinibacter altiplanensis]
MRAGHAPSSSIIWGTPRRQPGGRSQLYIAQDQGYLDEEKFEDIFESADKVSRQLYHLIRHLEQRDGPDQVREIPPEYTSR